jgi:hypothetical protein
LKKVWLEEFSPQALGQILQITALIIFATVLHFRTVDTVEHSKIINMNTLDNLNRLSQHITACSSLHQRNGALTLGRKQPRII